MRCCDDRLNLPPLTPQDLELIRARYDGGIRFTDDLLRGLFSELKSSGFLENAIVVVTSDHGEEFGEHGGLLHGGGKLYDELLRVPLIIAGGGLPEGQVIDRLVSSVDIAPTILALAGIERGSLMVGRNLIDPMPSTEPEVVFSQWEDRYYSVRTRDWKLITDTKGVSDDELYHVAQDPAESDSVADQFPDRVDAMQQVLASWKEALDTSVQPGAEIELDETTLERLRSLGYLR